MERNPMEPSEQWATFINEVTSSDTYHYLWLRSLSYLEYIGYRKMVKSLSHQEVGKGIYHHLTDEIRHSFMLKELADKGFDGKNLNGLFNHRFVDISEGYFQDLDQEVKKWVIKSSRSANPYWCYILVSYIIEKRAIKIYPQYYLRLQEVPYKYIIQKIIKDEQEHLNYIEETIQMIPELDDFEDSHLWAFEDHRFSEYLDQFQGCLQDIMPQRLSS